MAQTITDVLTAIEAALANSATLSTWCTTNYSKAPSIFIGIDPLEQPEFKVSCPIVAVLPGGRIRASHQDARYHTIKIRCALHDTTAPATGTKTNSKVYGTLSKLDAFANIVDGVIVAALNGINIPTTQGNNTDEGDEITPPFFISRWTETVICSIRP